MTSTRTRFWLISLSILSILPFLIFAIFATDEFSKSERNKTESQLVDGAQVTAKVIAEHLKTNLAYLSSIATSEAAQRGDLHELYLHAQRISAASPEIHSISLVSHDQTIVFETLKSFDGERLTSEERTVLAEVFETGKPAVSGPYISPVSLNSVTSLGFPIIRDGKVIYCLRLIFLTNSLNEMLLAQNLPPDWTIGIVFKDGRVVARSRLPDVFVGKLAAPELVTAIRKQNTNLFDGKTLDGILVKGLVVKVPNWDWYIAIGAPIEQLNVSKERTYLLLLLFGFSVASLGAILTYWLPKTLSISNSNLRENDILGRDIFELWPSLFLLICALLITTSVASLTHSSIEKIRQTADHQLKASAERAHIAELVTRFDHLDDSQQVSLNGNDRVQTLRTGTRLEEIFQSLNKLKGELIKTDIEAFNLIELENQTSVLRQIVDKISRVNVHKDVGTRDLKELLAAGKLAGEKIRIELRAVDNLLKMRTEKLGQQLNLQSERTIQLEWLASLAAGSLTFFSVFFWLKERRRRKTLYYELLESNLNLEQRVLVRTVDLQVAKDKIRQFSVGSVNAIESERKRISREVHDQIGQIFTAIKMIIKTLAPGSLAKDQNDALTEAIKSGIQISRRIAAELRPPLLDDLGLAPALNHYLSIQLSNSSTRFNIDIPDDHGLVNEEATQLFRIVQEATTNVVRYANAKVITIRGRHEQSFFQLEIHDDGIGFDTTREFHGSLGLIGIRERAEVIGGSATIRSTFDVGTTITILIPR
nr:cache domain-containing protein [Undibacterium sp. LX40W]